MASLLRRVGAEFTANSTTAGYQWFQHIAPLPGGGFVMAWIDQFGDGSGYGITAQRFDSGGAKLGGEIRVNNLTYLNQLDPSVAGLASGGFVVTWTGEGNGTSSDIKGRMFDSAGLPLGPEFTVNTADTIDQQGSQAVALPGGGFVVHWLDTGSPFGGNDPNVRAQIFDSAGARVGSEFTVNTAVAGTQRESSGTAIEGGGFVIVWADYPDGGQGDIKGQVFDSAGNRVGGEFTAPTNTAGYQWNPDVAALPGGGFVVSWQGGVAGAQVFDSAGAKVGSEIAAGEISGGISSVNVTAVSGGFLLAWQSTPSVYAPTVRGQLFDAAGNRIGDQFQLNEAPVGGGYMDLATLASGRVVASWNIDSYDVRAAVFRAPLVGTPGVDVLAGTADDDGIAGLASNDELSGGGGDDVLDGGLGADRMTGGTGHDLYVVDDSGDETIELAGEGVDGVETSLIDYRLQAHVENLTGNSVSGGSQTLRGNALDNVLTGGSGSDTFHLGAAGNDVVKAGSGDDLLVVDWQDSTSSVTTSPAVVVSGSGASGGYRDGNARSVAFTGIERVDIATGSGDDVVELTRGGSSARTGGGNDKVYLGSMIDTANGGSGIDGVAGDYRDAADSVVWDLSAGPFEGIEGFEYFLDLKTGDYNDVITTTAFARSDRIDGGRGADEIALFNGHDIVSGGTLLDFSWDTLRVDWRAYDDDVQMSLVGSDYGGSDGQIFGGTERSVAFTSFEFLAILTGGGNDSLVGGTRGDILNSGAGNDTLDGGAGTDMMAGGAGDDVYFASTSADVVIELANEGTDEIRTALTTYNLSHHSNVENLTATSDDSHDFRGNSGNNVITGGGGNDMLRLYDGGNDTVLAGGGNDNIFLIGSLTGDDVVNGGAGNDTLILQGDYVGGLTLTANVTQIELISILAGSNTNFGESGAGRYDYALTTHESNFAAGIQARINGSALLEGEDFTFDGSAETDARFVVYGGRGKDTLIGGQGNDIFFLAEERFATGDTVNGGASYDGMFLRGNYTIDFNAPGYTGLFTNIENLTLTSATDERYARGGGTEFDYNLVLSNAIVKPGEILTVSGTLLMASESMMLDGSAESDGILYLFGGRSNDTLKGGAQADILHGNLGVDYLTGGGGADVFRYNSTAESASRSAFDQILDFTPGTDKVDLSRIDANSLVVGDQAFTWIGHNSFSGSGGEIRTDNHNGWGWFIEGDTDGDQIADFVIFLALQGSTPLSAADFLL